MAEYDKYANSWLYNLGDKLGDMIILSVLWLIFSLPIITIGPASAALYYPAPFMISFEVFDRI